jgi:hypothetical protein
MVTDRFRGRNADTYDSPNERGADLHPLEVGVDPAHQLLKSLLAVKGFEQGRRLRSLEPPPRIDRPLRRFE